MVSPRLEPWISKEDYINFKRLAPDDPALPDSYEEWLNLAADMVAIFCKSGVPVETVDIRPTEFAEYCKSCNINPDGVARAAYAVTCVLDKRNLTAP